jgi:hypothetical protein
MECASNESSAIDPLRRLVEAGLVAAYVAGILEARTAHDLARPFLRLIGFHDDVDTDPRFGTDHDRITRSEALENRFRVKDQQRESEQSHADDDSHDPVGFANHDDLSLPSCDLRNRVTAAVRRCIPRCCILRAAAIAQSAMSAGCCNLVSTGCRNHARGPRVIGPLRPLWGWHENCVVSGAELAGVHRKFIQRAVRAYGLRGDRHE